MGNIITGQGISLLEAGTTKEFIFLINPQVIYTAMFTMLAVFILFILFGKLLYAPVKSIMEKRTERIRNDIDKATKDKKSAEQLKLDYEEKIKVVEKEAEEIISEARKKALIAETKIISDAKEEANRIFQRAQNEIQLEKAKMKDEIKTEIVQVATLIATQFVTVSITDETRLELVNQTLKEMGDATWLN